MLFACFSRMLFCMLSKDVVCMLSHNKNIYIENINKNTFNKFLIAAPVPYLFKNCQVSHPCSIGN